MSDQADRYPKYSNHWVTHMESILHKFDGDFRAKYAAGQEEHGGRLWEKPDLLGKAIEEVLDLVAYLYTIRGSVPQPLANGSRAAYSDIWGEYERICATKRRQDEHTDGSRLMVLTEEVGEVARSLLPDPTRDHSYRVTYDELKQVAAFALHWMAWLRASGKVI